MSKLVLIFDKRFMQEKICYHFEYLFLGNSGDMSLPLMFWDDGRVEGKGKDETGDYTISG